MQGPGPRDGLLERMQQGRGAEQAGAAASAAAAAAAAASWQRPSSGKRASHSQEVQQAEEGSPGRRRPSSAPASSRRQAAAAGGAARAAAQVSSRASSGAAAGPAAASDTSQQSQQPWMSHLQHSTSSNPACSPGESCSCSQALVPLRPWTLACCRHRLILAAAQCYKLAPALCCTGTRPPCPCPSSRRPLRT